MAAIRNSLSIAPGSAGQVLTSNGAGAAPSFQAAAAGGNAALVLAVKNSSSTNTTGDGTVYTLVYDVVVVNRGSNYNSGTGVYTSAASGQYQLTGVITVSNLTSSHTGMIVRFTDGGGDVWDLINCNPYACQATAGVVNCIYPFSALVSLSASSTHWMTVSVSGGTKTVTVNGGGTVNNFGLYGPL